MPDRRLRRPILSCSIVVLTFVAASAFGMWVQGAASQLSLVRHTSHSPSASNRAASGQSVVSFKSYAYDANGNMTSATDPMDIPTSYTYDAPTQKVHDFYVVVTGGTGVLVHNEDGDCEPGVVAGGAMFSSDSGFSNAEAANSGDGLARTADTVSEVAARAGVSLEGTTVQIIDDPEYLRYLDLHGACACAPFDLPGEIHLGPASFVDEETLANTLGHESEHLTQYAGGYVPGSDDLEIMEAKARAAGQAAVEHLRGSGQ